MDRMIRCITSDGSIMAAAADSTYLVATAQQIHGTSPVATAALGRLLTGASLMGSMLKKENASLTLKINGGGPLGTVVAIADSHGNCRGCVDNPAVELPLKPNGKLDVGTAVGANGILGVLRDFGEGSPYMGHVEIKSGEIAEDLTNYYAVSEQIPTVCALGVLLDKGDSRRLLAGGMLIQVLPGADQAAIDRLERNAGGLKPVTTMLAAGMSIEEMCKTALEGFEMEILDEFQIGYVCNCSKERVLRAISTLKPEDILSLADEKGFAEAKCQYCGHTYQLSEQELKELAEKKQAK
ncbi:Hsp33 family molecular chaperone HslO [Caproiciproducens sp. CPB-2]|uniref:Hsp33 family molecular chaperone HslO n=1 Tax=Caproiciproducens sp. CPB-2 TaxID=3030017 RepID=UPI0023DB3F96|nr:Hsp33 family molecular chaperone HslO [Caproiciproducens sp. CPB-2]MDF1495101.1 Hsp33 family molecular chaperone HslO [Caproiciproducens sp. CPB-2]